MAGHYELPESIWALIADFLSVKKQRGSFINTIGSCSMVFCEYCALESVGVICRGASGHGRRFICGFVTGETMHPVTCS